MDLGLLLVGLGLRDLADVARAAEAAGFESVWTTDHLVVPSSVASRYPYNDTGEFLPPGTPMLDPWVVLTACATATSTIGLGTDVYVLPLRHPFSTARAAATLDRLSNGRLTLGVGVGWMAEEYAATQVPFAERGRRADELIVLLRRLWTEPEVEHHGEFYEFDAVHFAPKPSQRGGVPIVVGGTSTPALRRAARFGDGWIDAGITDLDVLAERCATLQRLRAEAGRGAAAFSITTSAPRSADEVRRAADLGVTRVLTSPPPDDRKPRDRFLAWIDTAAGALRT
jgi:probable F420-dependent oxidoreductase